MDIHVFLIGRTTPVTIIHAEDTEEALKVLDDITNGFNNGLLMRIDKYTIINSKQIERIELKERAK